MSKTLARRVDVLEAGRGGVGAPSRFRISFGEDARRDEVVVIVDTVAGRSHYRRRGEAADDFAVRALTEPGEPWKPVGTDLMGAIDLKTVTDAQLADLAAVGAVLEGKDRP